MPYHQDSRGLARSDRFDQIVRLGNRNHYWFECQLGCQRCCGLLCPLQVGSEDLVDVRVSQCGSKAFRAIESLIAERSIKRTGKLICVAHEEYRARLTMRSRREQKNQERATDAARRDSPHSLVVLRYCAAVMLPEWHNKQKELEHRGKARGLSRKGPLGGTEAFIKSAIYFLNAEGGSPPRIVRYGLRH